MDYGLKCTLAASSNANQQSDLEYTFTKSRLVGSIFLNDFFNELISLLWKKHVLGMIFLGDYSWK